LVRADSIPESWCRFDQHPDYQQLRILQEGAEKLGVGNPFFRVHDGLAGATSVINGETFTNFSSYNYLGLAGHPDVNAAAKAAIPSPPGEERAVADRVLAYLRDLGVEADEDAAGAEVGSTIGNLFVRIPGTAPGLPLFFCAHLDTVPLDAPVEPVEEDGVIRNRNQAILGADNKAAIATILGAVRRTLRDGAPGMIRQLTCADILEDTIRRIFTDDSVSEIFAGENQLF